MENKFYEENFEQFLRDTTDDFRMYPSKRVWSSLYNNLHPSRRWPSLTVCLLLICSILFIGITNHDELPVSNDSAFIKQLSSVGTASQKIASSPITSPSEVNKFQKSKPGLSADIFQRDETLLTKVDHASINRREQNRKVIPLTSESIGEINSAHKRAGKKPVEQPGLMESSELLNFDIPKNSSLVHNEIQKNLIAEERLHNNSENDALSKKKDLITTKELDDISKPNRSDEQDWMEDYAFHNRPPLKIKSGITSGFYFTPSVGYRTLFANTVNDNPVSARPSQSVNAQINPASHKSLDHNSAFNFEMGYNFIYPYNKRIRLKAGAQLNYTDYSINAYDIGHYTLTTLLLNDPGSAGVTLSQRSSRLGNTEGNGSEKLLKNNTVQISIPVGGDFRIAGKHSFQWFAGASLQPTYIVFGNSYLISSDQKYYVYDAGFIRKWNLNAGIETFVSFKAKNGINFSAGPQFRYQLLSTYNKQYSYTERLYNLGIKLGVSRNF